MNKPKIGIMLRPTINRVDEYALAVEEAYRRAVLLSGGIPVMITPMQSVCYYTTKLKDMPLMSDEEKKLLTDQLEALDGFLLPGGNKMIEHDFYLLDYAIKNDVPVLGICLGMQTMSCYRDQVYVEENSPDGINHCVIEEDYVHKVEIKKDSLLYKIVNKEELIVNSLHRYHALENEHYLVVAHSTDGLIEAMEHKKCTFHLGIQWHPERLYDKDPIEKSIIDALIEAASVYQNKKRRS